jgi:hypothetical protein
MRRKKLRTRPQKVITSLLSVVLMIQFLLVSSYLFARESKDIILVLDTSMSMIGQAGGRNIFDKVKNNIREFIDKSVQDGDRVTFVTFDTDAKIYPSVLVDDDNDRDILKKYISMTESTGLWTNTHRMIYKVFDEAEKIAKEKEGRKTEIVIMTDAIDDPPPGQMKKLNLNELAEKYGKKKDLWIYVFSFSNLKNSEAAKKLGKDLTAVTDKVKIIETGEPEKGKNVLIEEQKKSETLGGKIIVPLLIAIGCILLLLAVLFLIKRFLALKVTGKLEYWNNEIIEPYIQHFDLSRRPAREVLIGNGFGCVLNIRDINIKTPITIQAVKHEGKLRMKIGGSKNASVEMVNREPDSILQDGDIFKTGNYTFKYFAS